MPSRRSSCSSSYLPLLCESICAQLLLIVSTGNSIALPGILRPCRARASLAPWSHHHSLDDEGDANSGAFCATGLPSFDLWECRAHPWPVLMACPVPSPHWKNSRCLHRHSLPSPGPLSRCAWVCWSLAASFAWFSDLGLRVSRPPRVCHELYLRLCWQTFLGKDVQSCDFLQKCVNKRLPTNVRGQCTPKRAVQIWCLRCISHRMVAII